jgi:tetratricopeptide (TPR) repeat protein
MDRIAREVASLEARIEADPKNPNAYLNLASLLKKHDRPEKAREVLQRGLGPTGNHFSLAVEVAELDIEPFRKNLALTEERLAAKPRDEELRKIRQQLLREILSRELNVFRLKAERFPTEKSHRLELGIRLMRLGQTDEAIRELQGLRGDARLQPKALLYLGYCFKQRNNWRLAQRNFEEALALLGGDEALRKEVLFELARGCADNGDLARAIELGYELANLDWGYRDIGKLLEDWQARLQKA